MRPNGFQILHDPIVSVVKFSKKTPGKADQLVGPAKYELHEYSKHMVASYM